MSFVLRSGLSVFGVLTAVAIGCGLPPEACEAVGEGGGWMRIGVLWGSRVRGRIAIVVMGCMALTLVVGVSQATMVHSAAAGVPPG